MALKADHSTLPKEQPREGCPPDESPRFASALVAKLQADDVPKATANSTRLRHSDAGKCARALAFGLAGFPAEPMDPAGHHVTNLGTLVHEAWQEALAERYGDAVECEVKCQVDGLDASGHIDAVIEVPRAALGGHDTDAGDAVDVVRIAVELKTMGGFGYKLAVGERGQPDGPRHSALVQGALNAYAVDADELVIVVMATEAISKGAAAKKGFGDLARFCAEWTYTRDEYRPIAEAEVARMQRILDLHDDGKLAPCSIPDPEVPRDALVVDPASGRWEVHKDFGPATEPAEHLPECARSGLPLRESDRNDDLCICFPTRAVVDTGTTWMCGYCQYQPVCVAVANPGAVAIDDARERVGGDS